MLTTYFKNLLAGNIWGAKRDPALPEKYYLGLSLTAGHEDGSGTQEPSADGGYKRVEIAHLGEPAGGVVSNEAAIEFPEATADWLGKQAIPYYVIFDQQSGGNLLVWNTLKKPRIVQAETVMIAMTGELRLRVDELPE